MDYNEGKFREDKLSPDNDKPVVSLRRLSKSFFEGNIERLVLDELDAHFISGRFSVLLGKSGSGKSTLLNLISGIEIPTRGDVIINGLGINQLTERERTLFRRDNIGFIFQFFNLIPTLTVLENVTLPGELAGSPMGQLRERARSYLSMVGLIYRQSSYPDRLSGGEQQRVAIARALASNPMLILADEPTGNLDEETGGTVLGLLLKLTRSDGRSLIMATHNDEIAAQADHLFTIHDGRLIQDLNRFNPQDQSFPTNQEESEGLN